MNFCVQNEFQFRKVEGFREQMRPVAVSSGLLLFLPGGEGVHFWGPKSLEFNDTNSFGVGWIFRLIFRWAAGWSKIEK